MSLSDTDREIMRVFTRRADAIEPEVVRRVQSARYRLPHSRLLCGVAVVGLIALVAVLVVAGTLPVNTTGGGRKVQVATRARSSPATGNGAQLQLAAYRFQLPSGFHLVRSSCGPGPLVNGPSVVLGGQAGFSVAASRTGCVQALLTTSEPLATGTPVDIDGYSGTASQQSGVVELDVAVPTDLYLEPETDHGPIREFHVLLVARGVSAQSLIQIAESGLSRRSVAPATACQASCG